MDIIYFLSQVDRLRIEHGMTKAEFYKAVDISASAVSQWRHKVTVPAKSTIQKIADLFGVEPSFLTGEQKENSLPEISSEPSKDQEYLIDFIRNASNDTVHRLRVIVEQVLHGQS